MLPWKWMDIHSQNNWIGETNCEIKMPIRNDGRLKKKYGKQQ